MAAPVTGTKLLLLYWGAKADLQAVRKGHDFVICRANRLNSAALRTRARDCVFGGLWHQPLQSRQAVGRSLPGLRIGLARGKSGLELEQYIAKLFRCRHVCRSAAKAVTPE